MEAPPDPVTPVAVVDAASSPPQAVPGRIVQDFLYLSGSRYLGTILGIVRGLVIPKLLDPAHYGVFKSFQTLSELSRMATLGVPSALFRELPISRSRGEDDRSQRLLDNGFWSTTLSAVPFALALLIGGLAGWIHFKDVAVTPWYLLFIPLLFVDRTKIFFDVVFTGQGQFVTQAKVRFLDEIATTVISVLGAWRFGFDGFLAAIVLTNGAVTAMAWWASRYRIRYGLDTPLAREMMTVGFPQLLVGLSNTVYSQLDRIAIVAAGLGMTAVGWYSVGMTICDQMAFGAQMVARVIMPRMMEHYGREESIEQIRKFVIPPVRIAGLAYSAAIVLCALAAEVVFSVWLTRYEPGLRPTQIMLVGTYFMAVWSSVHPFFLAIKKQRYLLFVFLGTIPIAALFLALAIALDGRLEAVAAAATVTDCLFTTSALWVALGFFVPRAGPRIREIARIYAPFALALGVWVIAELVRRLAGLGDDPVRGAALSAGIFCAIFVVPALLLVRSRAGRRAFGWDDIHGQ